MLAIQQHTCIRFVRRRRQPNYVVIEQKGDRCKSAGIGMNGGAQYVSLADKKGTSCMAHHIIVHELLHVVGLWHEHARFDRDKYLVVHKENIPERWKPQFQKVAKRASSTYGLPYNYLSIMHYDAFTISANGKVTMEPKDRRYLYEIGHQERAHELDWEKVRRIYNCQGKYPPAKQTVACEDKVSYCKKHLAKCGKDTWTMSNCRKSCGLCRVARRPGSSAWSLLNPYNAVSSLQGIAGHTASFFSSGLHSTTSHYSLLP